MANRPPAHRASGSERRCRFSISPQVFAQSKARRAEAFLVCYNSRKPKHFFSLCPRCLSGEIMRLNFKDFEIIKL
ncbi:MAG: hypothetical protein A2W09_02585 [Deltaproteobacteria bacterium RBG_16_50_11]|nr:MAG: hypothetical protein A2W09_02585 [Deltaproteobacteria bacterium RBG_16_50_11]